MVLPRGRFLSNQEEADIRAAVNSVGAGPPRDVFQQWAETNAPEGSRDRDDDPDGDGVTNFVEFAMGSNPNLAEPQMVPLAAVTTGPGFTFTYRRRTDAPDLVNVGLEVSESLDFSDLVPMDSLGVDSTDMGDGVEEVVVTLPAAADRLFVRTVVNSVAP